MSSYALKDYVLADDAEENIYRHGYTLLHVKGGDTVHAPVDQFEAICAQREGTAFWIAVTTLLGQEERIVRSEVYRVSKIPPSSAERWYQYAVWRNAQPDNKDFA
jgi:hypothetical protein